MFDKTKAKVNKWLDEKPGRKKKMANAGYVLVGIIIGTGLVKGIQMLNNSKPAKVDIPKAASDLTEPLKTTIFDPKRRDLARPNMKKGVLKDFFTEYDGLYSKAVIVSGEDEFLDMKRIITVDDLGELGKTFINAEGTYIRPWTPVDLTIVFQDGE